MKRIILCLFLLLIVPSLSFAQIYYKVDNFDGKKSYYTTNNQQPSMLSLKGFYDLDTTFNLIKKRDADSRNLIIQYSDQDVYYMEPIIRIRIDDTVFTLTTDNKCSLSQTHINTVDNVWSVSGDLYTALMNTKNDVLVRFNYHNVSGEYTKDYKLKYKYIKEVQDMYNTYGNKATQ